MEKPKCSDRILGITPHSLHSACLVESWIQNQNLSCPVCQSPVSHAANYLHQHLCLSSKKGDQETVKKMISVFWSTQGFKNIRFWAMIPAAIHGHIEILRLLKGNLSARSFAEHIGDAICGAAENGKKEAVEELLSYGVSPIAKMSLAFTKAADNGHLPIMKRLEEELSSSSISARDVGLGLRGAAKNGHKEVVQYIAESYLISDNDRAYAIKEAQKNNHLDIATLLDNSSGCILS